MKWNSLGGSSHLMLCLTSLALYDAGCGTDERVEGANNDLRIESNRVSEGGFKYIVSRNSSLVTLTVQRTSLKGATPVGDPEIDSPYDSDIILRNRHGFPFLTSSNHGIPKDPEGEVLSMVPNAVFIHSEQLEDLQLIVDAADALRDRQDVRTLFRWEIRRLRSMAAFALQNANNILNGITASEPTPTVQEFEVGLISRADSNKDLRPSANIRNTEMSSVLSSTFTHQVQIRRGPCFFCGDTGEHSAVLLSVYYDSGGFIGSVSTQNHGREATDPSMTTAYNCPRSYSGRSIAFPNFQPYVSTDLLLGVYGDAGGCHTGYGVTSGHHVCNDDSQAEYNNIKYNLSGTWQFCQDSTLAFWAPYCN